MKFTKIFLVFAIFSFAMSGCVTSSQDDYALSAKQLRLPAPDLPIYPAKTIMFDTSAVCAIENVADYVKESDCLKKQLKKFGYKIVSTNELDTIMVPKVDNVIRIVQIYRDTVRIENEKFIGYSRLIVSVRKPKYCNTGDASARPRYFQAVARCELLGAEEYIAWAQPGHYESFRYNGLDGYEKPLCEVLYAASCAAIDKLMGNPEFRKMLEKAGDN